MKKKIYKLGVIGQKEGKCCKQFCLDCEVIRKNIKQQNPSTCKHHFLESGLCVKCGLKIKSVVSMGKCGIVE